jgi:acyl-CoA reductase-like NAD-dependent aldehyde dehydrogenase
MLVNENDDPGNRSSFDAPRPRLPELRMLVGGQRLTAANGKQIAVEDPADESVFAHIPAGTADDIDKAVAAARRYFVQPTVFVNTRPDSKLVKEEIFGPVVVATPFKDSDDVVRQANDTRYGLAANIWTRDLSRAHLTAARLQAGSVWINTHGAVDVSTPFGGVKESGLGRELSYAGLLAYTETKTITALLD